MTKKELTEALKGLSATEITMARILLKTNGRENSLEFIKKVKESRPAFKEDV